MTPFRILLSDSQIADIATFVRASWGNKNSPVSVRQVRELRDATDPTSDHVIVLRLR
jgi:mono/diheme cytochrome c family protein